MVYRIVVIADVGATHASPLRHYAYPEVNWWDFHCSDRLTRQLLQLKRKTDMNMAVTTTFTFEGYRIKEYKGIVRGIIVRSPTIAQGFMGGLKSIVGGQIGAYTDMCEETRQQAYDQMIQHAQEIGANAIVGLRYDTSQVASESSATEVLCYGTAVVIDQE